MDEFLKVKLIDLDTGEALISPSGNDYFKLDRLPAMEGAYTYMKPYAPQKYIVVEINEIDDGMFEAKLKRVTA